jgi:hypothetical protein
MKKTLLITGVLLALTATAASAAGVNLSWTDCGAGGQQNRDFACQSNAGSNVMVASFDPPAGLTKVVGVNLIYDLQSASDPLPAWWDLFNPGACRGGPTLNTVFANATCVDYFLAAGAGGITAYLNTGSNKRRLGGSWSANEADAGPVQAGTEYYAVNVVISNAKTVGGCAGCGDGVCIVLNEIQIGQPAGTPGESPQVTNPRDRNFITWQGGAVVGGCPGATPTINKTWGQVKSIYR